MRLHARAAVRLLREAPAACLGLFLQVSPDPRGTYLNRR